MTEHQDHPWEQPGYSDVASARRAGGELEIAFANGDVIRVSPERFGISGDFQVDFDPEDALGVRVSAQGGTRDVSWTQLRVATDPDFAQEMRRQDAEQTRRLGLRLRALREDRGLSQKDLAHLVEMSPPQLSKIESGAFDLRVSTVQNLLRAMSATFADVAGPDALEVSQKTLRKRSEQAGVPKDVIERLLAAVPRASVPRLLSRAFGWSVGALESGHLSAPELAVNVRFKTRNASSPDESPLLNLAYTCSQIVRAQAVLKGYQQVPEDVALVRAGATDSEGRVTLERLVSWTWDRGIPVVPLRGRGAFCAAAWSIDSVPVAVMKEPREPAVFWLFDLAHELGHIALGHVSIDGIVDVESPQPSDSTLTSADSQERDANRYALELLLGDHRGLVSEVRQETRGNYLRFKGAVATVANRANVSAGLLGMVTAFELTDIGEAKDRWGSATNLAQDDGLGRPKVEAALSERIDLSAIPPMDAALLAAAVGAPDS